ncbi:MAG: enhanced intracellular survival protein Eis, partial [Halobacteriales archaeon]
FLTAGSQGADMVEYRPVPEDDVDAYRQVQDYAFRAEAGPGPGSPDDASEPDRPGDRRALYEDGRIVTTAVHYPFTITVRGDWVPAVGLGGVATRPEHRHQGYVRAIVRESLAEYRERDWPVALLWPFDHPFYRQFGWGRLGSIGRYEFEPEALAPVTDHRLAGGRFERLRPEDYEDLQRLDERIAAAADLTMRRTEAWYRHRFFDARGDEPFVYGWYADDRLAGYLRYEVEKPEGERQLQVSDFGNPDAAATVNLLRFIHRHAAQAETVQLHARPSELLFELVEDPQAVDMEVLPGPMGRLVEVSSALAALPAPPESEAQLTVSIADDLAPWNDGPVTIAASDGRYDVQSGAAEAASAELPIETLSRLACGSLTAQRAADAGRLEADGEGVSLLADLFPPRETFLREFF